MPKCIESFYSTLYDAADVLGIIDWRDANHRALVVFLHAGALTQRVNSLLTFSETLPMSTVLRFSR